MTWHATGQSKEKGKMNHPCDGRAWKYFDMMKPEFSGRSNLQHVAGHIDNIQHTTVDVYERNFLNVPPPKKDNPAKDAICHQCGEVGHWRRNC
ncbi:zinc finger, CCHC-type containing protein, partial [Tanacetum coccineum]